MNDLQRLHDLEALKQLKSRYCRFVDLKQWEPLRRLFTADACFEGLGSVRSGGSVTEFIDGISARLAQCISIHHCHMPDLVFVDDDRARGVWAMVDFLQWPEPLVTREAPEGSLGFVGYGHYEEEYRRTADGWRIAHLRLTRQRIDPLPANAPAPRPGFLVASENWLGLS